MFSPLNIPVLTLKDGELKVIYGLKKYKSEDENKGDNNEMSKNSNKSNGKNN